MAKVKDRFRVRDGVVFRVKVRFLLLVQWRGTS